MPHSPEYFNNLMLNSQSPVFIEERERLLSLLLAKINEHRAIIKESISKDFLKPDSEVDFTEIIPVTSEIKYTLSNLRKWVKGKKVSKTLLHLNAKAKIIPQPKGVILIIAPWNYPFSLCLGPLVSAIAAGNRVVIKPSEFTPNTSLLIKKIVSDVFPSSIVHVETGDAKVAAMLTNLPFNHIFFTGSPAVGKLVMGAASKNLCSITLELGGKSPCVLGKDYSVETFADRVVWGKFINAGQTCIAPDYLIVPQEKKEIVIQALIKSINEKFPDSSMHVTTDVQYTRIVNEKHTHRLAGLIENAIKNGAKLEYGGEINEASRIIKPTILSNITTEMAIDTEEIFGPILPVYTYNDIKEVFETILAKPRPLATYLFSRDKKWLNSFKSDIRTGALVTNDVLSHYIHKHLPFGGVNNSGIGRSHGYHGFLEFSNQLSVLETGYGPVGADFITQPYTKRVKFLIDKALKYL